jgi:hypothetical protein
MREREAADKKRKMLKDNADRQMQLAILMERARAVAQMQMAQVAAKQREEAKEKERMLAKAREKKKRQEEEKIVDQILKGSQQSAASAKNVAVPTPAPINNKIKNAQNTAANAKAAGMEAMLGGRRRRGRTHRRR